MSYRVFQGIRGWGVVGVLLLCSLPFSAAAESSSVTAALVGLTGQARLNALVMLSNTGHLAGPYTPADVDQIVTGMESLRGQTLWALATHLQKNLTVPEILQLLRGLVQQERLNALVMLGNTGHLAGPYAPADVDQILVGMESLRGQTLWALATYLQKNLPLPAVLQLLRGLVQQERLNALVMLGNTGHLAGPYAPADVDQILVGMEGLRGQTLAMLTTYLKSNLSSTEVAMLLNGLTGQDRVNALAWLSNAGRVSRPFTLTEIDAVTGVASPPPAELGAAIPWRTTSDPNPWRTTGAATPWTTTSQQPSTITRGSFSSGSAPASSSGPELPRATFATPAAATAMTSQKPPTYSRGAFAGGNTPTTTSAPVPPSSTSATPAAAAAVNARIAHLWLLVNQQQPYLYGSTGAWDDISIVARDLPVRILGMTDYRALYDQLYFATFQYTGLASKQLSRASLAVQRGDLATANALLNRTLTLLTQRDASYSGAVAMANHDLERAQTYVRATYEASKWAAGAVAVGIPGASCMVDAAGSAIDFALNTQESGVASASTQLVGDLIINYLPMPPLGGHTLADAMEGRAGKLLSNAGVIDSLKTSLSDPVARRVVIDAAKSLVAQPGEDLSEAAVSAQLDRVLATVTKGF